MRIQTALITGASSGIGEELAELFARDKTNLILVARSTGKLQGLADRLRAAYGIRADVITSDLSQPGASEALFEQVTAADLSVDCLVNNAGFGSMGYFDQMPFETHSSMILVNVLALTALTRLFIPAMVARGAGRILNIGSTASFQPGPNAAVYYATKAYVRSFSEGLQTELSGTGVTVTCMCPGPTKTNFGQHAEMEQTPAFRFLAMDVKPVALAGYRATLSGRTLVVPGLANKILQLCSKYSHWGIVKQVMKFIMQPLPPRLSERESIHPSTRTNTP